MITSFLMGGLGNQMFQISAAASLAIDNNDKFGFDFDRCCTLLQGNAASKYASNIYKNIPNVKNIESKSVYLEEKHSFSKIPYSSDLLLKGYFQSEKYFCKNKNFIKNLFYLCEENKTLIAAAFKGLNVGECIGVHLRRGDYLNYPSIHPTCSFEYYKEAFSLFENRTFIFMSDDIDWAKKQFPFSNCYFSDLKNEVLDMQLLTMTYGNIIANSSFGWWGSYLNENSSKKIVAPKVWFGKDGPQDFQDIVPSSWIKI